MISLVFAQLVGEEANTFADFGEVFLRLLSSLIPIGGIVLFIMLIMGGFSFMTASGDPRKAEAAKATITYAIIGIVVLACAFLIIQVIAGFAGVPAILNFQVRI